MKVDDEQFGKTADYLRAFEVVLDERVPPKHIAMLGAHLRAPRYTTTWARLAKAVGYPTGSTVNLQYGRFAERIARQLGLGRKPADPIGQRWWLWVLVRWADERDVETGHTSFVLRRPVVEALQQHGFVPTARAVSSSRSRRKPL